MKVSNINPIKFAKDVNENFLNYQLTAFPFTDEDLNNQAKELLKGKFGNSPMIKGPYISLSKSFLEGENISNLVQKGIAHPALEGIAPFPTLFKHQEKAFTNITNGYHCLVSTGTGSGKTESFMLPIINTCLNLRDSGETEGITAILVYPMNALANDQLDRLRSMLAGSGISFGIYVGSTPEDESKIGNIDRLKAGNGKAEFTKRKLEVDEGTIVSPYEERLTEKEIIENPPRILLTNVNQLELLLTRKRDIGMFINAPLKYIVFDEVHTYTGAKGAEVSCLIRRLKAFCGKSADEVICIGTSATISDEDDAQVASNFASRFFGVDSKKVKLVEEEYKKDNISNTNRIEILPSSLSIEDLDTVLDAIENDNFIVIKDIYYKLTGINIDFSEDLRSELFDALRQNSYIYNINKVLNEPVHISEAITRVNKLLGRKNFDEEIAKIELFCYLALGSYTEQNGNVLLKPKVHYFVKGLEGVVTTFDETNEGIKPVLNMNKEAAMNKTGINAEACFSTLVCNSCGQHYFEGYYRGFRIEDGKILGSELEGNNFIFQPSEDIDAGRAIFTNKFFSLDEDEELEDNISKKGVIKKKLSSKVDEMYLCRHCGTIHTSYTTDCSNPKCKRVNGVIPISIVKKIENNKMLTCPCCGHKGVKKQGIIKYEAIRRLKATAVSDNHILCQNIINEIKGNNKKLIMFADNRQDAAFQAGWMKDRTRRYRFRHLVYEFLCEHGTISSIDEIVKELLELCIKDNELAVALAPEVFSAERREAYSNRWMKVLERFWRFTLIRELATTFKTRDSLENWGVIKVFYYGINESNMWIKEWSEKLDIDFEILLDGINSLLDKIRRDLLLYDEPTEIFSRQWSVGDYEVQNGFIPYMEFPPKGLVEFEETTTDKKTYIKSFRSNKSNTAIEEFVKKWGVNESIFDKFMNELWIFLTDETKVLKKVQLRGRKDIIASNVYQLDSDKIGITIENKRYKCNVCQRVHTRVTPNKCCTAWQCKGKLELDIPKKEDYNINMLKYPFSMVIAREHSAQVPAKEREEIEESFKNENGQINCLVATPTLEMGVDIGALDVVLMRNVPPKPSNYWQRAGRAGRKHRMAVIYTYCRQSEHDKYFFNEPLNILNGKIEPPKFNLRNEIMVKKHVHATVLSQLIRMTLNNERVDIAENDKENIRNVINSIFPTFINEYLFYDKEIPREEHFDVSALNKIIHLYKDELIINARDIFISYWPADDIEIVSENAIEKYVNEMTEELDIVITRMYKRMRWAVNKIRSIDYSSATQEEDKLVSRCKSYLAKLKKTTPENYTLSVLAMEGFLPGYGVYESSINAYVKNDFNGLKITQDFELNRPSSMAVREFVPGNMIYANGAKYKCSYYHLAANKEELNLEGYFVDIEKNIIKKSLKNDINYNNNAHHLQALPINDVTLNFTSRIIDEELNRFQMPVNIMGELEKYHSGIRVYSINNFEIKHHFGQKIRLINVGPAEKVKEGKFGYPICSVCGATRSPYSSDKEISSFLEKHRKSCGKTPDNLLLYSDSVVDGIKIEGFASQEEAVNFSEAIKIGASIIIDMDIDDLQYFIYPSNNEEFTAFIYDPMPGGSGILQQIIESWTNVIKIAIRTLSNCEGKCQESCYSCMRTYRNVFVHGMLDRYLAKDILDAWIGDLELISEIPPNMELISEISSNNTNAGEKALYQILQKEGFPSFIEQKEIQIGAPYNRTIPDLYYEDKEDDIKVAIYLDGLSKDIHGNQEKIRVDRFIRNQLEDMFIDVIEISYSDLNDPATLKRSLAKIARKINKRNLLSKYR